MDTEIRAFLFAVVVIVMLYANAISKNS